MVRITITLLIIEKRLLFYAKEVSKEVSNKHFVINHQFYPRNRSYSFGQMVLDIGFTFMPLLGTFYLTLDFFSKNDQRIIICLHFLDSKLSSKVVKNLKISQGHIFQLFRKVRDSQNIFRKVRDSQNMSSLSQHKSPGLMLD